MKKFLALTLVSLMAVTLLVGCGSGLETKAAASGSDTPAEGTYKILAAHGAAESSTLHQGWLKFKELIEEKTNGVVVVDLYANQTLGGDREYTEASTQGNVTMGSPSTAPLAAFDPAMNIFESPFIFGSREEAYDVLDGEIGQSLLDTLEESNLKGLGFFENGFRELTANKEITTLADLKGLKIRVMENDIHLAIWKNLGANPSPLAFGELFTSLQQKTFDAQENPLELIYNTKFYEVQDHVMMMNHVYTPYVVFMNLDFWNSMPEEYQQMVQDCLKEAINYQRDLSAEGEKDCRKLIEDSGLCTVVDLTDEQLDEFKTACQPVYDIIRDKVGADIVDPFYEAVGVNS